MMADRNSVIKALACMTGVDKVANRLECKKRECPYLNTDCELAVIADALALLETNCKSAVMAGALALLETQKPATVEEQLVLDKLHTIEKYARVNNIHWMADGAAFSISVIGMLCKEINGLKAAQEPVEPEFNGNADPELSYWSCGACGAFIWGNVGGFDELKIFYRPNFCQCCGREVKWE